MTLLSVNDIGVIPRDQNQDPFVNEDALNHCVVKRTVKVVGNNKFAYIVDCCGIGGCRWLECHRV